MFAGIAVQGEPVVGAVLRAYPVGAVQKGRFAMEIDLMVAAAAGTNSMVLIISAELSFLTPQFQLRE